MPLILGAVFQFSLGAINYSLGNTWTFGFCIGMGTGLIIDFLVERYLF